MTTHNESRIMAYSAEQMYELIADIKSYPEFLPWCDAARFRRKIDGPRPGTEIIEADLVISFKVFRERFGSKVTLDPQARRIDVEYLDGPFRRLVNNWHFEPIDAHSCKVSFHVDFEFKSKILQGVIGMVFTEAMQRVVRAFEQRANVLYSS